MKEINSGLYFLKLVLFLLVGSSDNGNLAEAIGPGGEFAEFDEMGEMQQVNIYHFLRIAP